MWLIIILVVVSCTDLTLYFLHLFGNFIQLVLVCFTPVQLCTILNFLGKIFIMFSSFVISCKRISVGQMNGFEKVLVDNKG